MKRLLLPALALTATLAACSKDALQTVTAPATGSYIKFYNFGVNAPGVNFFANETKVTAVGSSVCTPISDPKCTTTGVEATTGTAYSFLGNAGLYSELPAGSYSFSGRVATVTDNGLSISKLTTSLADGQYYSFYQSGLYDAVAKSSDSFIVSDPFPATIDYTVAYVRFVNAISNSSPMTLYAKNTVTLTEVPVGGAVAYKNAGTFTAVPQAVYDLNTRLTGSSANAITRTAVSLLAGRVYTISSRGDMTVVSATATNRPFLDNTLNR